MARRLISPAEWLSDLEGKVSPILLRLTACSNEKLAELTEEDSYHRCILCGAIPSDTVFRDRIKDLNEV